MDNSVYFVPTNHRCQYVASRDGSLHQFEPYDHLNGGARSIPSILSYRPVRDDEPIDLRVEDKQDVDNYGTITFEASLFHKQEHNAQISLPAPVLDGAFIHLGLHGAIHGALSSGGICAPVEDLPPHQSTVALCDVDIEALCCFQTAGDDVGSNRNAMYVTMTNGHSMVYINEDSELHCVLSIARDMDERTGNNSDSTIRPPMVVRMIRVLEYHLVLTIYLDGHLTVRKLYTDATGEWDCDLIELVPTRELHPDKTPDVFVTAMDAYIEKGLCHVIIGHHNGKLIHVVFNDAYGATLRSYYDLGLGASVSTIAISSDKTFMAAGCLNGEVCQFKLAQSIDTHAMNLVDRTRCVKEIGDLHYFSTTEVDTEDIMTLGLLYGPESIEHEFKQESRTS